MIPNHDQDHSPGNDNPKIPILTIWTLRLSSKYLLMIPDLDQDHNPGHDNLMILILSIGTLRLCFKYPQMIPDLQEHNPGYDDPAQMYLIDGPYK